MVALLVISSVVAALVPVERRASVSSTETTTVDRPGPSGALVTRTLHTGAKKPQTIAIELGDQLALQVTSKAPDQVEIPGFGEIADVDRDAPARFDLLPFEPGRYAVRLVDAKQTVGWIVVRPPDERQHGESSTESPGSSTTALTPGARSAS